MSSGPTTDVPQRPLVERENGPPRPLTFPKGGRGHDDETCSRCPEPATHGYVGVEGLLLCDGCFASFGRWFDDEAVVGERQSLHWLATAAVAAGTAIGMVALGISTGSESMIRGSIVANLAAIGLIACYWVADSARSFVRPLAAYVTGGGRP